MNSKEWYRQSVAHQITRYALFRFMPTFTFPWRRTASYGRHSPAMLPFVLMQPNFSRGL